MKLSQLAKTNKNVSIVTGAVHLLILVGYFILIAFPYEQNPITPSRAFYALIGPLICDIIAFFCYRSNKESIFIRYICLVSVLSFLCVSLFDNHSIMLLIAGFVFLVIFSYYNDYRFTLISCISILVVNIITVIIYAVTIPGYLDDLSMPLVPLFGYSFFVFVLPNSVKFVSKTHEFINYLLKNTGERVDALTSQSLVLSNEANVLRNEALEGKQKTQELSDIISTLKEHTLASEQNVSESVSLTDKSSDNVLLTCEQMALAVQEMDRISNISKEISAINNTIDNISLQINILSLNASVESARAGETGKGFAAVAEEVRNLAVRSSQASNKTHDLVNNIVSAIKSCNEKIKRAEDKLNITSKDVQEMKEKSHQLSSILQLQQTAVINTATITDNISKLVNDTADTADKTFNTSQSVHMEAEEIKQLGNERD